MKAKSIEQLKEEADLKKCHKINLIRNVENDLKQRINNKICFSVQPIFYMNEDDDDSEYNKDIDTLSLEYKEVVDAFLDAGWSAGVYYLYEDDKLGIYLFVNKPEAISLSAKEILKERYGI
jgi:hypothetical protein